MSKRKTHCPHGHAYSEANTIWAMSDDGKPYQQCKTCRQARRNAGHKKRYREDEAWREMRKKRSRENYIIRQTKQGDPTDA